MIGALSKKPVFRRQLVRTWGVFAIPIAMWVPAYLLTDQIWQDYVLLFGTLLIAFVLVPTLLDQRATVPRSTSIPGSIAVFLFIIGFLGLELWLTAFANVISFLFWVLVAVFRAPSEPRTN